MVDSMHRIRTISTEILSSKMSEAAAVAAEDTLAKKDIMSLLVRARSAEKGQGTYRMSDEAMISQVVCRYLDTMSSRRTQASIS
jgi:hypothetical protein